MYKKTISLACVAFMLLLINTACSESSANTPSTFKSGVFENTLQHPESITYDGTYFYASEFGPILAPHIKNGSGSIAKIDANGKIVDAAFAKTYLNKPKGLFINNNVMLVCDIDSLKAINMTTGKLEYAINFNDLGIDLTATGGTGLNDVVVGKDNNIAYVTITNNSKIYEVDLNAKTKKQIAEVPYANGIAYNENENVLYANGFTHEASLTKIDLNNNYAKSILEQGYAGKTGLDGLVLNGRDLYISDWGTNANGGNEVGVIVKYNLDTKTTTNIDLQSAIGKSNLNGPADMIIANGFLFIPALGGGKLYAVKL